MTIDREKGLRMARRVYRLRVLGLGLGFLSVASVFYERGAPSVAWAALVGHGFLWPHLAWLLARRAADPQAAERRNLLIDSTTCGVWIALMHFSLLPSVVVAAMQSMDKIGWGRRFLLRAVGQMALAAAATAFVARAPFRPDGSMAVMILSLPLIVAYPLAVAAAIQRAGALARERRKAVEQAAGLREQLAHVARVGTLGEMAAGLAHELNQPLTAIHLEAATALELGGVDDMRSALSTVTEQALRAGGIVRRMRTFARQSWSNRELTSVEPIVRDVVGLLEHDLRLAGIETELVFDDAAHVVADRIEIEQVLVNLVRNASDAMSESRITHRQLTIRTAAGDGRVRVSVTDTGGGIPPAMQLHLFHPFQTTKSSGLGLGLSICQSIIEAHGGRIGAGPHPARGSLFFFELPAAELMKAAS